MAPRPLARRDDIHTEEVDDGLLVYDETRDTAHSLNRTAAAVWRSCDGSRDVKGLVVALEAEIGETADEDLVRVALDDLAANGLLENAPERDREAARLSRRRFIRRAGTVSAAALALPVVHSIVAPTPAAAQTGSSSSSFPTSSFDPNTSTIFNTSTSTLFTSSF